MIKVKNLKLIPYRMDSCPELETTIGSELGSCSVFRSGPGSGSEFEFGSGFGSGSGCGSGSGLNFGLGPVLDLGLDLGLVVGLIRVCVWAWFGFASGFDS